jgi:hypothetical protein
VYVLPKKAGEPFGSPAFKFGILTPMFNKTFYKFVFGFIAVVVGVLAFILVIGGEGV